jgi:hypothetical protein
VRRAHARRGPPAVGAYSSHRSPADSARLLRGRGSPASRAATLPQTRLLNAAADQLICTSRPWCRPCKCGSPSP